MSMQKLSEAEKDFAISEIVEKGVVKPGDKFRKMLEVGSVCTFHTLFFGVGDCFLLGVAQQIKVPVSRTKTSN